MDERLVTTIYVRALNKLDVFIFEVDRYIVGALCRRQTSI